MPNYVVVSDIHFFHRRTPTKHIVDAFWQWLVTHHDILVTCKMFVLAGDVFDRFIPSHYPDIPLINQFFYRFGRWLAKHDILLVVLEGTAIHDRKQFQSILPILQGAGTQVKYYTTVCTDTLFDMSILFVPDNWSTDPEVTARDAKEAVLSTGNQQCDIAIMHGSFPYQLPMMKHGHLDQTAFEQLVRHRIHIGHVHTPSQKGKVDAQGSFDRISYGESEVKGGNAFINGRRIRLPNVHAYPYRTLRCSKDMGLPEAADKIHRIVEEIAYLGWIRIIADRYHPVYEHLATLAVNYPTVKFEKQYEKEVGGVFATNSVTVTHLSTDALMDALSQWDSTLSSEVLSVISTKLGAL